MLLHHVAKVSNALHLYSISKSCTIFIQYSVLFIEMLMLKAAAAKRNESTYSFLVREREKATKTQPSQTDNIVTLGMSLTTCIKRQAVAMK